MKKLVSLFLIFTIIFAFSACGGKNDKPAEFYALKDPSGWGLVKLMTDRSYAYSVTFCDTQDEIAEALKNGSVDFAALPVDTAVKLFNETNGEIQIVAITSTGCYHMLSKDKEIKSLTALEGRKIFVSKTEPLAQRFIAYLLDNADGGKVKAETVLADSNDEVVKKSLDEGDDTYVVPVSAAGEVLSKESETGVIIGLKGAWEKLTGSQFAYGCIVVRKEYAEKNPERITELREHAEVSLNFMSEEGTGGKALSESGLFENKTIAENIIPGCAFTYIDGDDAVSCVTDTLTRLYGEDSAEIGGEIPGSGLFCDV